MKDKKPIKIYNEAGLNFCTIGAIIQQLDVYALDEKGKKLELGAFFLGENSPQYRFAVEPKKTQINVTIWVENSEVQANE